MLFSLAGFLSARSLIEQYIPKPFLKYSEEVMERERQHNPKYADMDARESLKKSHAKLLHLQSKDDLKVKFELGTEPLKDALKECLNCEFVVLDNRGHDPQRTIAAAEENKKMLNALNSAKKHLKTQQQITEFQKGYNWDLITEQDSEVWDTIFAFLEK